MSRMGNRKVLPGFPKRHSITSIRFAPNVGGGAKTRMLRIFFLPHSRWSHYLLIVHFIFFGRAKSLAC